MLRANDSEEDQKTFQWLRYSYPDDRIMRRFASYCESRQSNTAAFRS